MLDDEARGASRVKKCPKHATSRCLRRPLLTSPTSGFPWAPRILLHRLSGFVDSLPLPTAS